VVATDPVLLLPEHRQERNDTNFFSTYASGPLPAERGEAVYLLPPGVMARFAGKDRMYYALATFADQSRSNPQIMHISPETAPSITISRSFTGRTRAIGIGNVRGGLTGSYTGKSGVSADWSGDSLQAGKSEVVTVAPGRGSDTSTSPASKVSVTAPAKTADAFRYDDGWGRGPWDDGQETRSTARSLDDSGNYFTDTDQLDQYLTDTRADDTINISSRDDAKRIITTFRASTGSSPWTSLDRATVADRLTELIDNPRKIHQGALNLCGPAAFFCMWNARDPVGFARYACQLFDTGRSAIGSLAVTPGSGLVQKNYAQMASLMGADICPQADWMVLGALRNSEDVFWQGSFQGDPRQNLSALTRPEELAQWMTATGVWSRVSNEANWMQLKGIPHAEGLQIFKGTDIALLINTNMLANARGLSKDTNWLLSQFPNHFVVLLTEIVHNVANDNLELGIWSWGDTMTRLSIPMNDFLNNYYGAVIGRMPSSATSQSLGSVPARNKQTSRGGNGARPRPLTQGPVAPMDVPSDPAAVPAFMADWMRRQTAWKAGVPDTTFFPFSAICQLADDRGGTGTGFYIGSNRILTAAHVVSGASSITVSPGKNSRQTPVEQFGHFTVNSSSWQVHPQYNPSAPEPDRHDFDIAVICVDTPPPNNQAFDNLEELLQSRPSPILVCGYGGWSADVDPDRQHIDGDMVREVTDNRLRYNLQTEPGNSGSPVFYYWGYEDESRQMSVQDIRLVGVHTSSAGASLNECCRLTQDKITWINSAACPTPATAQSLGYRSSVARPYGTATPTAAPGRKVPAKKSTARPLAHNVIQPTYVPSDPEAAKRFMLEWQGRRERWRAGVTDTTIFPHSAICRLRIMQSDGEYIGTGFYIDRDLILTCAHNCHDATSITVIPGKNDLASNAEPFGSFTVRSSDWTIHPSYNPTASVAGDRLAARNFDLAVIRVTTAPPNNLYFPVLEELLVCQDSPIIVCGYAAETVSADRQHLDGDQIVTVQDERFEYDIQTEGGNSGSPVFYLYTVDDPQSQECRAEYHVIGVHTHLGIDQATGAVSQAVNGGCRLTQAKITWVNSFRSAATSQSLGYRNQRTKGNGFSVMPRSAKVKPQASMQAAPGAGVSAPASPMFDDASIQRLRAEAAATADHAAASGTDTVSFMNALLRKLYNSALRNPDGSDKPLGSTVRDTMAALQGYGFAQTGQDFEFVDAAGQMTKGASRPERLRDSVEQWMEQDSSADRHEGWSCFGASLLDGYHGVIVVLSDDVPGSPGKKLYWVDQIHGGFDEVTGQLDQRIATLTQSWWDPQDNAHRPRTRITVWPLSPKE
jgi:V8-like Glu-specific endopeptidase